MRPTNEAPPILFVDRVQSLNYDAPVPPDVFSVAGTAIDFDTGDIISTGLHVDGVSGDVQIRGEVTATQFAIDRSNGDTLTGIDSGFAYRLAYESASWTDPDSVAQVQWEGYNDGINDRAVVSMYAEGNGTDRRTANVQVSANDSTKGSVLIAASSDFPARQAALYVEAYGAGFGSRILADADEIELDGTTTIDAPSGLNNHLNLKDTANPTTGRPYIAIFGGSDAARKMYIGYPDTSSDQTHIVSEDGNLMLVAGTSGAGKVRASDLHGTVDLVPTLWTNVSFLNNWSHYGSSYQNVQYRKEGDVVRVRGLARNTLGAPTDAAVFYLPSGFRPPNRIIRHAQCANIDARSDDFAQVRVDITSTGAVAPSLPIPAGNTSWISLEFAFSVTA